MVTKRIPQQGDIVWISFDPTRGHEQAGKRPALIVSKNSYNKRSSVILCCPITSKSKSFPLEVSLVGKHINGYILPHQIRSLDWKERGVAYIEKCPSDSISTTLTIIKELLG